MPATLAQIQTRLEQATALRDDALQTHALLALSAGGIDTATSQTLTAKLNGYQREVELLMKIERDLIANGKADGNDLCVLSDFDASRPSAAAKTPAPASDAQMAPREAPRNDASAAPLPASGDVF